MGINTMATGQIITGGNVIIGAGAAKPLSIRGAPVDGVDGVAAQGTLTIAEPVTDGDQFTIDTIEYTLLDTPAAAYDIAIGADEAATKVNIVAAINASGTPGTEYFAGTLIHPTVSASAFVGDVCTLTAKSTGVAGNSIATVESGQELTNASNVFDDTTLGSTTAGVDDVDGSYEGSIPVGGFVYDYTNDDLYENTGTTAKPAFGKIDA
jgi:hypothetical protein